MESLTKKFKQIIANFFDFLLTVLLFVTSRILLFLLKNAKYTQEEKEMSDHISETRSRLIDTFNKTQTKFDSSSKTIRTYQETILPTLRRKQMPYETFDATNRKYVSDHLDRAPKKPYPGWELYKEI